jgi:hypothetical protein
MRATRLCAPACRCARRSAENRLAQSATTAVSIGVSIPRVCSMRSSWSDNGRNISLIFLRARNEKFMLLSRTVKLHASHCARVGLWLMCRDQF